MAFKSKQNNLQSTPGVIQGGVLEFALLCNRRHGQTHPNLPVPMGVLKDELQLKLWLQAFAVEVPKDECKMHSGKAF